MVLEGKEAVCVVDVDTPSSKLDAGAREEAGEGAVADNGDATGEHAESDSQEANGVNQVLVALRSVILSIG